MLSVSLQCVQALDQLLHFNACKPKPNVTFSTRTKIFQSNVESLYIQRLIGIIAYARKNFVKSDFIY